VKRHLTPALFPKHAEAAIPGNWPGNNRC
jgi:hypothetical protein